MNRKRVLFLTGSRSDFSKLKPLIQGIDQSDAFEGRVLVTGMHTLKRHGETAQEVYACGFKRVDTLVNQSAAEPAERILASTIYLLSKYLEKHPTDLLVVHGDRVEALAGASVGVCRNVLVAHVEGGELSGSLDGILRHSVSKLAHLHFVSNLEAKARLIQMGEKESTIFPIGSPAADVLLSGRLPSLSTVQERHGLSFPNYAVALFHPDRRELQSIGAWALECVHALIESGKNYVVIASNNDEGCEAIFEAYRHIERLERFRLLPSVPAEDFAVLLKHAEFIIGNSSAGIQQAPLLSVPTIDIGQRQSDRFEHPSILKVEGEKKDILRAIRQLAQYPARPSPCYHFGDGNAASRFLDALRSESLWSTPKQKQFVPLVCSGRGA